MSAPQAGARSMRVTVVGSLNLDLVVKVPRHPRPGETILGGDATRGPGGKGANQALAVARLGVATTMVGRVGDDEAGRSLRGSLAEAGVDTTQVRVTAGVPTGLALISVDPTGENTIIVSPGANARVGPGDVAAAGEALRDAAVTLLQLEIPLEAVAAAVQAAGGLVVLNPAPARELPAELLERVDVLVPNRSELAVLTGGDEPADATQAARLASRLHGPRTVVVTLGAQGALVVADGQAEHVPAPTVTAVDTTAAGDAFCGGLAVGLVAGQPVADAVRWAALVAAVTATRHGAQTALPTRAEVEAYFA